MTFCRVCAGEFTKDRMGQIVCGIGCARKLPKQERKETRARLEKLKTRAQWLKEAQQAVNAWIRHRDKDQGCISCGTREGKVNAGHYLSTGARPELRFHPNNIHRQCEKCNTHLSGNLIPYRKSLIDRIGIENVDWLEGPHPPAKWTIGELRDIKARYKQLIKESIDA